MDEIILRVRDLTKQFGGKRAPHTAVDHISFELRRGECMGIIGESGSGKSTTANLIAGNLKPTFGDIQFYGDHLQMVFQNPIRSFSPKMNILTSLSEALRYQAKLPKAEIRRRCLEAMDMVKLPRDYAKRYSGQLSGGECQRAAIARALLISPDLLICDEITSALDVSVQAEIIQLLAQLRRSFSLTMLMISHDIALVSGFCDRIAVMHNGRIVEIGDTTAVIRNPQDDYTKLLLQSVLTVEETG